jgi:SAM-dependent methyltransferase
MLPARKFSDEFLKEDRGNAMQPEATAMTDFYEFNARAYFERTNRIDPTPILTPLLRHLQPGASVLDIGCGSGRDLKWFKARGFDATGLERSPSLAVLASDHSSCPVAMIDLFDYNPPSHYDCILLIGTLVHLPKPEFPKAMRKVLRMLKAGGIMYVSMKAWGGSEKGEDGRVFQLWSDSELRREFGRAGLDVLEHSRSRSLLGNRDVWLGYILQAGK